ncbi:MAG: hypothetical protein QM705_05965 [Ancrocorticia sp.]
MAKGHRLVAATALALSALLVLPPIDSFATDFSAGGSESTLAVTGQPIVPGGGEATASRADADSQGSSQEDNSFIVVESPNTNAGNGIEESPSPAPSSHSSKRPSKSKGTTPAAKASPSATTGSEAPAAKAPQATQEIVVDSDTLDSGESDDATPPAVSSLSNSIGTQAAVPTRCEFADQGSGNYASTLCWLDLSSITTEYVQQGNDTHKCTPTSGRRGSMSYTCEATTVWVSKLGAAYGSASATAIGASSTSETTAKNNASYAARANLAGKLYASGSTFYGPITDYPLESKLSDMYTMKANLSISADPGSGALAMESTQFPTYDYSFLGNNGFYTISDESVKPALYQSNHAGETTAKLSNIKLLAGNEATTGFSVVVADAETSDEFEWITWSAENAATTNGRSFTWLPNDPVAWKNATSNSARRKAAVGNACPSNKSSDWASLNPSETDSAFTCAADRSSEKNGTPMLQASPKDVTSNFSVTQVMYGGGREAIAFGVLVAGGQVNVEVADRIVGGDGTPTTTNFTASVSRLGDAQPLAETETGASALTASTDAQHFPVATVKPVLSFASAASSLADEYTPSWACNKSTAEGIVAWSQSGTSEIPPDPANTSDKEFLTVGPREFIDCTVTYTPAFLTLVKSVDKGTTTASDKASKWKLTADQPGVSKAAAIASGTKVAVARGEYSLTEESSGLAWSSGYRWSGLTCTGADAVVDQDTQTKTVTSAKVTVPKKGNVTCTYTNTANEPRLNLGKMALFNNAEFASGETIGTGKSGTPSSGSTITYALTLDNSKGTAPIEVNHRDYLRDVLDDADYVGDIKFQVNKGAVTTTSDLVEVTSHLNEPNPYLQFTGVGNKKLPAYTAVTVFFDVKVKPDSENWQEREKGVKASGNLPAQLGFELNNYLVKTGDPVPTTCPTTGDASKACTTHPVLAWAMEKDSLPLNGASLHANGDIHYKIAIRRLNPRAGGDITGIQVTDDLSQVFTAARWYPAGPVPYPAKQRGIYFYDAQGKPVTSEGSPARDAITSVGDSSLPFNRLPNRATDGAGKPASVQDIAAADAYIPPPAFTADNSLAFDGHPAGGECVRPAGTPGPTSADCYKGTWELKAVPFTMKEGVAQAEVWFSVRVGFASATPSDIVWANKADFHGSNPSGDWEKYWMPLRQVATVAFANTATIDSATKPPVPAATDPTRKKPGLNDDGSMWIVNHKVDGNYFVIRKDLVFRDPDTGRMDRYINMVGHELALEYKDPLSNGEWTPVEDVEVDRVRTLDPNNNVVDDISQCDSGDGTGTIQCHSGLVRESLMCTDWNVSGAEELGEECARFRPIAAGAQAGRWRADRLPAGNYRLTETQAPTHRRDRAPAVDATGEVIDWKDGTVPVSGAQVLPEPVEFRISDGSDAMSAWQIGNDGTKITWRTLEGQLDIPAQNPDGVLGRCTIPYGGEVSDLPTACINPTGYFLVLSDVAPVRLPRAGGIAANAALPGMAILAVAVLGSVCWKRKKVVA